MSAHEEDWWLVFRCGGYLTDPVLWSGRIEVYRVESDDVDASGRQKELMRWVKYLLPGKIPRLKFNG